MELDPYLAGAAFLVPSQLVVSGRATPSKALDMWSVNRDLCGKSPKLVTILYCGDAFLMFDAGAWARTRLVHGHDPDETWNY